MRETQRVAILAIVASLLTLGLKFYAYRLTGSVGIFSDALESFVNLGTSVIAFGVLTIAAMPADENHHYGHDKIEYFSSGIAGVLILVASLVITYNAFARFMDPKPIEELLAGFSMVTLSTVINWGTAFAMFKVGKKYDSITLEADAKHLMTDVWTSVGVIVAILIIYVKPQWYILDPIIGVLIAVHIFKTGIQLLHRSIDGLMDLALPPTEVEIIKKIILKNISDEKYYRKLRTRKSGSKRFIDFVVLLPGDTSVAESHALCHKIKYEIKAQLEQTSITIHVKPRE